VLELLESVLLVRKSEGKYINCIYLSLPAHSTVGKSSTFHAKDVGEMTITNVALDVKIAAEDVGKDSMFQFNNEYHYIYDECQ
jgi:hypothetical protein